MKTELFIRSKKYKVIQKFELLQIFVKSIPFAENKTMDIKLFNQLNIHREFINYLE